MNEHANRDVLLRIAEALKRLTPPTHPSGLEQTLESYF
ncbi:hypothetical protein MPC4_150100 [Methylocella tundrae]|uniref:Uncharacterized protein n=1 Tax=Methylocella tundrae TaxID=227605 RepID=A0A8B6M4N3_METTU|nr:hypothetical protein MPC1_1560003 [Methylocella tundrae]VTZ49319.1 hypothetical protein MPC4_150100 [Methylocella tundrae]